MRWACVVAGILAIRMMQAAPVEETVTLDDLVSGGWELLEEHFDTNALAQLELDEDEVQRWLRELERTLEGEYVLDVAKLRSGAGAVLGWLRAVPRLRPYAAWLQARLDYLEAADRLRLVIHPPSGARMPGGSAGATRQPTYAEQREVWRSVVVQEVPTAVPADRLARLRTIFSEAEVPTELIWLAEVESSFETDARSPSGAVGLFQLMPVTARALGLSLRPVDERLDPERNAAAAARHLRHLHAKFKDWPLAVAAYNAGEGRVARALERGRGRRYHEIASRLPAQTQMYVPKVEAVLQRREGRRLSDLPPPGG